MGLVLTNKNNYQAKRKHREKVKKGEGVDNLLRVSVKLMVWLHW